MISKEVIECRKCGSLVGWLLRGGLQHLKYGDQYTLVLLALLQEDHAEIKGLLSRESEPFTRTHYKQIIDVLGDSKWQRMHNGLFQNRQA